MAKADIHVINYECCWFYMNVWMDHYYLLTDCHRTIRASSFILDAQTNNWVFESITGFTHMRLFSSNSLR